MKKILFSFFSFLILLLFVSCPDGGGTNDYFEDTVITYSENDFDSIFDETLQSTPYLDVINQQLLGTSSQMEYSLDGGNTWNPCIGSVQDVTLTLGDHVIVRNISDSTWTRDLGTVSAYSGRPDMYPGNKLWMGINYFDDDAIVSVGDEYDLFSYINNIGNNSTSNCVVKYYLSPDRNINSSDVELVSVNMSSISLGENNFHTEGFINLTCPNLTPGIYYLGVIIDPENSIPELNEDNNVTLPDDTAVVIVSSGNGLENGAFKLVNSWGKGDWENIADGHYWMDYEDMIANNMFVFFYFNDADTVYEPKAVAVFNVSHENRNDMKITLGISSTQPTNAEDFYLSKTFETRNTSDIPAGGDLDFPSHDIVLDITEFATYLNDYDLYLYAENIGSTSGSINSFSVELYDDYSNPALDTLTSTSTGTISAGSSSIFKIETSNNISETDLSAISASRSLSESASLVLSEISDDEIKSLLKKNPENNDNGVLSSGGYRTGWINPTEEEWLNVYSLDSIETETTTRGGTFNGADLPLELDYSESQYFPPIGNQGSEGSCVAFSTAYYIHTFMEAKEHGWDLSGVSWDSDSLGLSSGGAPDSSLDKIFSPDFIYHQINNGVDNGSSYIYAVETLRRQGCATWDTMPYDTGDSTTWPTEEAWREAVQYRGDTVGHYYWDNYQIGYFSIEDDADIQLLKSLLSMGYIVTTGIYAGDGSASDLGLYDHLDSNDVFQSGYTWSTTNHAQTIVGYKEGSAWNASNPDA